MRVAAEELEAAESLTTGGTSTSTSTGTGTSTGRGTSTTGSTTLATGLGGGFKEVEGLFATGGSRRGGASRSWLFSLLLLLLLLFLDVIGDTLW